MNYFMVAIMRKRIPYNPEFYGIVGQLSLLFCCSNPTFSKLALAIIEGDKGLSGRCRFSERAR